MAHTLSASKWRSDDICPHEDVDMTFAKLNLSAKVLKCLSSRGFARPSPIQLQAIPLGRCGLDLIVQSKSGTGKTCVFLVVALEMVCLESDATQVLVIAPTREIALQIVDVLNMLCASVLSLNCLAAIGGTKVRSDCERLAKCHIVVGTPGRVKQLIELRALKTSAIRLLVLDEADKLMDSKFKTQMDHIFATLPVNKQMLAVSATMSEELSQFLSLYMRTPAFVRLNADNPSLIGVTQYYRLTSFHHLNHINFDNKIAPLIEILQKISFSQCLVFSNYQTRARILCDKLNAHNWPSVYVSAEKSQHERVTAINKLKKYKCRVLVSTDLTSRGIDVENVNIVINLDIPWDGETYLHRIGRAGRFGSRGISITLVSDGRELELFQKIIKESKLQVEELPQPIPENIWNHFSSNGHISEHSSEHQLIESAQTDGEINPWDKFRHQNYKLNDSKPLISFNDILEDYESHKKCLNEFKENINNEDYNLKESDNIEKHLSEKCYINCDNDIDSNSEMIKADSNLEICSTSLQNNSQTESNFDTKACINGNTEKLDSISKLENKNNNNNNFCDMNGDSAQILQTGFKTWASALFPPIRDVSSPLEHNQWMESNRYLWHYLIDPFDALNNLK